MQARWRSMARLEAHGLRLKRNPSIDSKDPGPPDSDSLLFLTGDYRIALIISLSLLPLSICKYMKIFYELVNTA